MKKTTKKIIQKKVVNQHEFRIVGMSRSGNHSIINWITRQIWGRFCFLNCAEPKTNPFYTARPLDQNKTYKVNYPDFDFAAEKEGNFSSKDYLIHSYEDCFLGMLNHKVFEEQHDAFVGASGKRTDVLILRDPFNLFASRKKLGFFGDQALPGNKPLSPLSATRIWKQHAREFIGEKQYLSNQRIVINYNLWTRDNTYRKKIAARLGLAFTDQGFKDVSVCAGGSSFDGLKFDDAAHSMKVLERWKYFVHDPEYRNIFDHETIRLSYSIFGQVLDKQLLSA